MLAVQGSLEAAVALAWLDIVGRRPLAIVTLLTAAPGRLLRNRGG